MSVRPFLVAELARLRGYSSNTPVQVQVSDPTGIQVEIDLTQVDSLGCAFRQITVHVPAMSQATFDVLKRWADALSQRITYLLEQLTPLEYDPQAGQVLIRSTRPDQLPDGTQYYEMVLSSHGTGTFTLKRFSSIKGTPGRTQIDLLVTHEVLYKLCDDLIDTALQTP
jgi:hypothetical protein